MAKCETGENNRIFTKTDIKLSMHFYIKRLHVIQYKIKWIISSIQKNLNIYKYQYLLMHIYTYTTAQTFQNIQI